jgi:ElaB/YqjD/DUF883 family membrane-anchored ribosome-binding protein
MPGALLLSARGYTMQSWRKKQGWCAIAAVQLVDGNGVGESPAPGSAKEEQMQDVTKDKLIEDLKVVAQDVEELLRATASQTGEKLSEARTRAEESLRAARTRLNEASDEIAERTRAAATAADDYVRDNPWHAVGIAAGIGFAVGFLLARR